MFDKKIRYKMYKAGKNWMVAGITTVAAVMGMVAASNNSAVHADQVQTQPAAKESKDQAQSAIQGQEVKLQSSAKSTDASSSSQNTVSSQAKDQAASSSAASSSSQASRESSADKSQSQAQTQSSQVASSTSTQADQASSASRSKPKRRAKPRRRSVPWLPNLTAPATRLRQRSMTTGPTPAPRSLSTTRVIKIIPLARTLFWTSSSTGITKSTPKTIRSRWATGHSNPSVRTVLEFTA